MMKQKKNHRPKTHFWRIFSFLSRKYKIYLAIAILLNIFVLITSAFGLLFMRELIDVYLPELLASAVPDFSPLGARIIGVAILFGTGAVAIFALNILLQTLSIGMMRKMRTDLFNHTQTLPISFFDTHQHGDLMSRYTSDVNTLRQMLTTAVPSIITTALSTITALVMMLILSWVLTIIVLIVFTGAMFLSGYLSKKGSKYFREQQQNLGALSAYAEEIIHGQKTVAVYNHQAKAKREFENRNEQHETAARGASIIMNILWPIFGNLNLIVYALVAVIGGWLILNGTGAFALTVGSLATFLIFSQNFTRPLAEVSQNINTISLALAGAGRVFEIIDTAAENNPGAVVLTRAVRTGGKLQEATEGDVWCWKTPRGAEPAKLTPVLGDVKFTDVHFSYVPGEEVLKSVSFYAKPGQKIALVGATGAGKTTVANLLNRFYDIDRGQILIDGIDINTIEKASLRRSIGIILQDTHLFTGTISDNIKFGKLDATQEEVEQSAILACADTFIRQLPQGYETMITDDGANLSEGQRQLIAIARVAIANPPILILDEATSKIDTRTENLVQIGMNKLMAGRTVLVIAHRLSTVVNSEAILLFEDGQIKERGPHEALMKARGAYYHLAKASITE